MALPFFYVENLQPDVVQLDEDTSRHVVQVLRMQCGDRLRLTDGKGAHAEAEIAEDHRKKCKIRIIATSQQGPRHHEVTIGISLVKNASRFEWFVEKATEIGIGAIMPLLCERTEKDKFRLDRVRQIAVSAMLQSQQVWLPQLGAPVPFKDAVRQDGYHQKFIAHCLPEQKQTLPHYAPHVKGYKSILLIGPEGDFTPAEVSEALLHHFRPVTLGDTRLRTETAALVAATLLCLR